MKYLKRFNETHSKEYYNQEDVNLVIELFQDIIDEYNLQKLAYDGKNPIEEWPHEPGIYYWFETYSEESRFTFNICFEVIEYDDEDMSGEDMDKKDLELWETLDKIFKNDIVELGKRIESMDPNNNIFYIGHYNIEEYQSTLNKDEELDLYGLKEKYGDGFNPSVIFLDPECQQSIS